MNKINILITASVLLAFGIFLKFYWHGSQLPYSETPNPKHNNSPFGMHGAFSRPFFTDDTMRIPGEIDKKTAELKEPYKHILDIGVAWVRPNSDIYWNVVQPTLEHRKNGIFNWTTYDIFHGKVPSGVNILGTIDARPWGFNDPTFKPYTWDFADEDTEKYYIKFIQEAIERYDGDGIKDMPGLKNPIKYWQVSNEPALRPLIGEGGAIEADRENLKKNLDPQSFSRLLEITYKTIKEKDPKAKIAMAGIAAGYGFASKTPLAVREVNEFYLPIIRNLNGKYIDIFDIHYYGDEGEYNKYQGMKFAYDFFRRELDQNGYQSTEIWFTETAVPSKPFGERFQAINLIKRYVYSLSCGAKNIFWWNMIEGEGLLSEEGKPSNHFGLIYDGIGKDDPGYGVKKLAYYTYKKMVEILEDSDWNSIRNIREKDGIYIYKLTKRGKSVWVAWNDNKEHKEITIYGINSNKIEITEAVPKYGSGNDVKEYNTAFETGTKSVTGDKISFTLTETPVFIEEK